MMMPLPSSPRFTPPLSRRVSPASGRQGFALIITIILMAFLVLLMVSMASLTRVETQIAANSQQAAAARENALLALNLALGKLQAAAGPDQRITATGDILATTQPTKKKWTGVWDHTAANPTPEKPTWLVSDPTPDSTAAAPTLTAAQNYDDASSTVRLVGAGSTDLTVTAPLTGNEIILTKQPLKASGIPGQGIDPTTLGNYAWWIGDEGVKARINLADPTAELPDTTRGAPAVAAFTPTVAQKRQSLMVPARVGGELLATEVVPPASSPIYLGDTIYPAAVPDPGTNSPTETHANFQRDLGKLQTETQVELLGTGTASDLRNLRKTRFHDFTVSSRGVLADVAAGGLKKDLTAGLLNPTIPDGAPANTDLLITVPAGQNVPAKLPSWGALRSYVQLQNSISGATPAIDAITPTDTTMGVCPLVIHNQFWIHATIEADNSLRLLYFPAVVLWNPYDVTLRARQYAGNFNFSNHPAQAYAEFTTASSLKSWKWAQSTLARYWVSQFGYLSRGITLDCPDLPPGKAVVFTPAANQNILTVTQTAPLNLKPGWRTHFWYEALATAPAGTTRGQSTATATTAAPSASDTPTRLVIAINNGNASFSLFVSNQLASGAPFWPSNPDITYYPAKPAHRASASAGAPWTFQVATTLDSGFYAGNLKYPRSVEVLKDTTTNKFKAMPTIPSIDTALFSGSPAFGHVGASKMTLAAADPGKEIAWLAQYNPAAQTVISTAMDGTGSGNQGGYSAAANYNTLGFSTSSSAFTIPTANAAFDEAYIGYDYTSGATQTVLFHLPRKETGVLSLGALQHANVHPQLSALDYQIGYSPSAMPAYAIGNAYADPRIKPAEPTGFMAPMPVGVKFLQGDANSRIISHFDLSLLLNRLLWDKYYFSGVPTSSQVSGAALTDDPAAATYYSANRRHKFYDPTNQGLSKKTAALWDYDKAAANLLVEGAFNINSTSREAWRAMLASARNAPVVKQDGTTALANNNQTTPFPRSPYPLKSTDYTTLTEDTADVYVGFRSLTDAQLDELATAIVAQIKLRAADSNYGPFRSMADFVNRRPQASTSAYQLKGLLQAAIDSTSINGALGTGLNIPANLNSLDPLDAKFEPAYFKLSDVKAAGSIPRAACLPGYLTQADLLQQLGPVLSARSDTFRVRTYGEVVNPATTSIVSRAWCEAIVQRLPEYVDNNATAPEVIPGAGTPNATFGRRFKIISFRWLSPSDL
jgi:hypothetical protein